MARQLVTSIALSTLAFAFAHGCNSPVEGGDSESHFLGECVTTCQDGLECLCGVCTKACTASEECTTLASRAECVPVPAGSSCAGTAAQTCDVACATDAACSTLGTGFGCFDGKCRQSATADGGGAAHDASSDSAVLDVAAPDPCSQPGYPEPPTTEDPSDHDIDLVLAERTVDLGDRDSSGGTPALEYRNVGFNLDGLCTSEATRTSAVECVLPSGATGVADGTSGTDNALGSTLQRLHDLTGRVFSSVNLSSALEVGDLSQVLRITGWNGRPNDHAVVVQLLRAAPLIDPGDGGLTPPLWDGTDVRPVYSNGAASSTEAYVVDGKLVAHFSSASYRIDANLSGLQQTTLDFELRRAVLSCSLPATSIGAGYEVDCVLAGAVAVDGVVHQLGRFPNPVTGGALCAGTQQYDIFKQGICETVDSYSAPIPTPSGSGIPCDAASFGVKFTAEPARLGPTLTEPAEPALCPPETDPANDSCGRTDFPVKDGSAGNPPPDTEGGVPDASPG